MADLNELAADEADENEDAHPEEQAEQQSEAAAKVEDEARAMGWVPKEEFKGDPERWRPADEYLMRGKEMLPIVNSRLKESQAQVARLEKKIEESRAEFDKQIAGLKAAAKAGLEHQRAQLAERYEARKEAAVEAGDTDAYRKAVADEAKAMEKLADKAEDEAEKTDDKAKAPAPSDAQQEWMQANPWFIAKDDDPNARGKDAQLTRWALTVADDVAMDMPAASEADQLAEIRKRLEALYPEKFGKKTSQRDTRPSPVEGGQRISGDGNGSAWAKLPADAKAAADELIKQDGLFVGKGEDPKTSTKDLAKARERYAASYAQG